MSDSNNTRLISPSAKEVACDKIAKSKTVCEIGAALNNLTEQYYKDVLVQAKVSFWCAITAAAIGTGIFLVGFHSAMNPEKPNTADTETSYPRLAPNISLVAGVLVQVIAGINFYLYARTSRQFSSFHICLERTNRFLLVNTLCHELSNAEDKDYMRKKLAETMMHAPMLTIAQVTGGLEQDKPRSKGESGLIQQEVACDSEGQALPDSSVIGNVGNGIPKRDAKK